VFALRASGGRRGRRKDRKRRTTPVLAGKGWVLAMLGRERPVRGCDPALQAARPGQPASGADAGMMIREKSGPWIVAGKGESDE